MSVERGHRAMTNGCRKCRITATAQINDATQLL
jgi:hypothetical protein